MRFGRLWGHPSDVPGLSQRYDGAVHWLVTSMLVAGCGRIGFEPAGASEAGISGDGGNNAGDASIVITDAPDAAIGTGMPPMNDDCNRAQVLVIGQATPGTTCDSTNYIQSGCTSFAPGDVFYEVMGSAGQSYDVRVSAGALVQPMLTCSMTGGPCAQSHTLTCAATGACRLTYLVETMAACGAFTITATQL